MELFFYKAEVKRVVDGDTIDVLIDVGFSMHYAGRVRFYGVNTPESRTSNLEEKKAGLAAKEFVEQWIASNNNIVYLKTIKDKNEKYGRILALNIELIKAGLAKEYFGVGSKTWAEFEKE
jgi:micrococcal nuclease